MKVLELREKIKKLEKQLDDMLTKGLERGNTYFYIGDDGEIYDDQWDRWNVDLARSKFGNLFRSKAEAEERRDLLQSILTGEKEV